MNYLDIQTLLEEKYRQYNTLDFIAGDPIQIPHRFENKEDIEISAFLTSCIAWGNRKMIIRSAERLMLILENSPAEFIRTASDTDFIKAFSFVHRTFQGIDLYYFFKALQNIYNNHGGLEAIFIRGFEIDNTVKSALQYFRQVFFSLEYPHRTLKHIPDVSKNSAAKRLNMFLMWMVRRDNSGVHFGLWEKIPTSALIVPLDVHVGRIARALGVLTRKQDNWIAAEELTAKLRNFDAADPVRFDFALFGLGVFDGFHKL